MAAPGDMEWAVESATNLDLVRRSFGRCKLVPDFLQRFYDRFFSSDPRVAALFAGTDLERQKAALRHGLSLVLLFAGGQPMGELGLHRIRERHSRLATKIGPDLFQLWVACLLETIAEVDPQYGPELERQWRSVLEGAVTFLLS